MKKTVQNLFEKARKSAKNAGFRGISDFLSRFCACNPEQEHRPGVANHPVASGPVAVDGKSRKRSTKKKAAKKRAKKKSPRESEYTPAGDGQDKLREALCLHLNNGFRGADVAREAGITASSLTRFRQGRSLGDANVELLSRYLGL